MRGVTTSIPDDKVPWARATLQLHANTCCRTMGSHTQQGLLQTPMAWPGLQVPIACLPQPTQPDVQSMWLKKQDQASVQPRFPRSCTANPKQLCDPILDTVWCHPIACHKAAWLKTPMVILAMHLQGEPCPTVTGPLPLLKEARCAHRRSPCHTYTVTRRQLYPFGLQDRGSHDCIIPDSCNQIQLALHIPGTPWAEGLQEGTP